MRSIISVILSVLQLILCCVIIALESVNLSYDAYHGTIYAGYWCSFVFGTASLMGCLLASGQWASDSRVSLVVLNLFNIIFSIILIIFTALFVHDPSTCYGSLCHVIQLGDIDKKRPVLIALLVFAIIMFLISLIALVAVTIIAIPKRNRTSTSITAPREPDSLYVPSIYPSISSKMSYEYGKPVSSHPSEALHYYSPDNEPPSYQPHAMRF